MKKILSMILSAALLLSCCGCTVLPELIPAQEYLGQQAAVEEALSAASLTKTGGVAYMTNGDPDHSAHLFSRKEASISYPFVKACEKLESNPIAAFFALKNAELFLLEYESTDTVYAYLDSVSSYNAVSEIAERPAMKNVKCYLSGRDEALFLRDVMETSAKTEDGIDLEEKILNLNNSALHYSQQEQISYAYYVYETDLFANVLCVYIHHDDQGRQITDVEFQMLIMDYSESRQDAEYDSDNFYPCVNSMIQMMSLIDAIEMNLTGTSVFHQYTPHSWSNMSGGHLSIPASYTIGEYNITVSEKDYSSGAMGHGTGGVRRENVQLINYSISK